MTGSCSKEYIMVPVDLSHVTGGSNNCHTLLLLASTNGRVLVLFSTIYGLTYCAPHTYLAQKGIHPFGKSLLLRHLSSCSCLIQPFSKPCSTRAVIVKQEQWRPLVSLQITLKLHWVPQLEPFEQATKGRDSKWVEPRLHVGV